jgi:hypothetical protein
MPTVTLPGQRTGVAYIWLIVLSPILLLLFSLALLAIGLWRDVDSVAVIGAVGVVASLILPRMQGTVEIGPGGVKGDLEGEIFREVILKGLEQGLPAEDTLELAADASVAGPRAFRDDEAALRFWGDVTPWTSTSASWFRSGRSEIARQLGSAMVAQSVVLDRDTGAIVERVAQKKKWSVGREVRVEAMEGRGYRIFDFVITTRKGPIFIETGVFSRRTLVERARAIASFLRGREVLATLMVVPDGTNADHPDPDVHVVEISRLEGLLSELPA